MSTFQTYPVAPKAEFRPGRKMAHFPAASYVVLLVACSPSSTVPEVALPNVEDEWLITVNEMWPFGPDPNPVTDTGSCQAGQFTLDLIGTSNKSYGGSHGNITMLCVGADAPATEVFAMSDSLVSAAPGPIIGQTHGNICFLGCKWKWTLSVEMGGGFSLSSGLNDGQTSLREGWIRWSEGGQWRVIGTWTAVRCSSGLLC